MIQHKHPDYDGKQTFVSSPEPRSRGELETVGCRKQGPMEEGARGLVSVPQVNPVRAASPEGLRHAKIAISYAPLGFRGLGFRV